FIDGICSIILSPFSCMSNPKFPIKYLFPAKLIK
ncbi:MAG: hypothetical protein ACJAQ1_001712, partial [Flavobacterium sp.]